MLYIRTPDDPDGDRLVPADNPGTSDWQVGTARYAPGDRVRFGQFELVPDDGLGDLASGELGTVLSVDNGGSDQGLLVDWDHAGILAVSASDVEVPNPLSAADEKAGA